MRALSRTPTEDECRNHLANKGTVLQLIPNEVMIKQQKGFNPGTNDWEFFALDSEHDAVAAPLRDEPHERLTPLLKRTLAQIAAVKGAEGRRPQTGP